MPELNPQKHPTIGQLMKDAGNRTSCFGKWNVSNLNRRRADGKFTTALYNLSGDIVEEKNLAASHGEKLQAMSDLLDQWESGRESASVIVITTEAS